jgi:hypothetical protein
MTYDEVVLFRNPKCGSTYLTKQLRHVCTEENKSFIETEFVRMGNHNPNSIWITSIRHPVKRFFSALFFSHAVSRSRNNGSNEFDRINDVEEKIKIILDSGQIKSKVYEFCEVNKRSNAYNDNYLSKVDIVCILEKMNESVQLLNHTLNTNIVNKPYGGSSNRQYTKVFSHDPTELKNELFAKYETDLIEFYKDDIEVYNKYADLI